MDSCVVLQLCMQLDCATVVPLQYTSWGAWIVSRTADMLQDESYCCEECVEACTVGGVRFTFYPHEVCDQGLPPHCPCASPALTTRCP